MGMTFSKLAAALVLSFGLAAPAARDAAACGGGSPEHVTARTAYSPEAARAAIEELGTYGPHAYKFPAVDDLRAWGADAVPDLLEALTQSRADRQQQSIISLLASAKVKGTGAKLIAMAEAHPYANINTNLYIAAADIDGADVFPALVEAYKKDKSKAGHATYGLVRLREQTLAWIAKELPKEKYPSGLTSLVAKVAVPADKDNVSALVGMTRDQKAKQHLAGLAIDLGVTSQEMFDVLLAGLRSKNAEVRTDAVWTVRAENIPTAYVETFRSLLEAELGRPNASVDHLSRELIVLGSTDRRVIDNLFGRLGSDVLSERMGSVLAIASYARMLDVTTATDLQNQVNDQLSRDQDDRFRKKLEKARDALAKRLEK